MRKSDAYPDVEAIKNWLYHKVFPIPWSADNAKWTIQRGEIRELSIEKIYCTTPEAPPDAELPFALISFPLIRGDREISASNAMEGKACVHYVVEDASPGFEFKKVTTRPEWLKKRGKW